MWLLLLGWDWAGTVGLGSAECVMFAGKPWLCRMTSAVPDLGAMAGSQHLLQSYGCQEAHLHLLHKASRQLGPAYGTKDSQSANYQCAPDTASRLHHVGFYLNLPQHIRDK